MLPPLSSSTPARSVPHRVRKALQVSQNLQRLLENLDDGLAERGRYLFL